MFGLELPSRDMYDYEEGIEALPGYATHISIRN
jgi:hypothetical protein